MKLVSMKHRPLAASIAAAVAMTSLLGSGSAFAQGHRRSGDHG